MTTPDDVPRSSTLTATDRQLEQLSLNHEYLGVSLSELTRAARAAPRERLDLSP